MITYGGSYAGLKAGWRCTFCLILFYLLLELQLQFFADVFDMSARLMLLWIYSLFGFGFTMVDSICQGSMFFT